MARCICGHKDFEHGEAAGVCDSECSECDCERFVASSNRNTSKRHQIYTVVFRRDVHQVAEIEIRAASEADALRGARAELDACGGWVVDKTIDIHTPTIRVQKGDG